MRMRHERRIVLTAFLGAAPMAVTVLVLVFSGDFPTSVRCLVGAIVVTSSLASAYALYRQLSRRLLTFSNVIITALGVEDRRFHGGSVGREDIAAEMVAEMDALARLVESRKISTDEGAALLRTVVAQMTPRRLVVLIWSTRGPFPSRSSVRLYGTSSGLRTESRNSATPCSRTLPSTCGPSAAVTRRRSSPCNSPVG